MSRTRLAALLLVLMLLAAGCGAKPPAEQAPASPEATAANSTTAEKAAEAPKGPVKDSVKPLPGYQAPNFTAQDVFTGESFTLTDLRGQVVFLNFWATWCPPCKAEMPEMEALKQELGDSVKIVALGADAREKPDKLKGFAEAMGLTFAISWDGGIAAEAYRVTGIPTSFFIDKDGVIQAKYPGPMDLEQMKEFVKQASGEATEIK